MAAPPEVRGLHGSLWCCIWALHNQCSCEGAKIFLTEISKSLSMGVLRHQTCTVTLQLSWDWRKILEVLILGQFVIDKASISYILSRKRLLWHVWLNQKLGLGLVGLLVL